MTDRCRRCDAELVVPTTWYPSYELYQNRLCRTCAMAGTAAYRAQSREPTEDQRAKTAASRRAYYLRHRDAILVYSKKYEQDYKEVRKLRREQDREAYNAKQRGYYRARKAVRKAEIAITHREDEVVLAPSVRVRSVLDLDLDHIDWSLGLTHVRMRRDSFWAGFSAGRWFPEQEDWLISQGCEYQQWRNLFSFVDGSNALAFMSVFAHLGPELVDQEVVH